MKWDEIGSKTNRIQKWDGEIKWKQITGEFDATKTDLHILNKLGAELSEEGEKWKGEKKEGKRIMIQGERVRIKITEKNTC